VAQLRSDGYRPLDYYADDPELASVIDLVRGGMFSQGDTALFAPIIDGLLAYDPYFVLADFRAYCDCQQRVGRAFLEPSRWTRMSVLNTARSGKFSSDRTILEYCNDTWDVSPVPIDLDEHERTAADMQLR
jgi:glycogen phosphorylase